MGNFGAVRELHPDDLHRVFGTTQPSRADVEANGMEVQELRSRWEGTVVVIYEGEKPTELFFTGYSGD